MRNTGTRPALETVQVYVRDSVTSVSWADKELKAYRQVEVAARRLRARRARSCRWRSARSSMPRAAAVSKPGEFELLVGPSSRDDALLSVGFRVADSTTSSPGVD